MSDLIVDSCVVFKWIVTEADSAQALRILSEVQTSGLRLILLDLALPEVTNARWKRHHRGLMTTAETG
jgi:predicted nucleic acid-binding protein